MSLFRKRVSLGLDIGSHSLKLALSDSRGRDVEVWSASILPGRTRKDEVLSSDALKNRVKALMLQAEQELKGWSKSVVVSVQSPSQVCSYLELPILSDDELEMAILSSISREVPMPIDSLDITHVLVTPLSPGRTAVFYSAWEKSLSQNLHLCCEALGLNIKHIEASGISLTRELFQNRALNSGKFYAIIDIGFKQTQIIIVRGGYPYYLRDIPIGGGDITYAIQVGSQASWREAEEIKCSHPLYELMYSAGPILSELSYELRRSLAYFQKRFNCEKPDAIYLSGGGSLLKDLPEWLEEELHLSVHLEDWQQNRPSSTDALAPIYKVSLGLALV